MKNFLLFLTTIFILSGCEETKKVKLEFTSNPSIIETGAFTKTGVLVAKSIGKNDIINKLNLDSDVELKKLIITRVFTEVHLNDVKADSVIFDLYCDAIPGFSIYKGSAAVKQGFFEFDPQKKQVKLFGVSLTLTDLLNTQLNQVITNGKVISFRAVGRTFPAGTEVIGTAYLQIDFAATYLKCVEWPDILISESENHGACN
ncbi:MAG: hypothetical protein IPJ53_07585 [Saprospiraceae bacterium]|nr:hypothetical protein [Candidatus Vicinibacter affinis]